MNFPENPNEVADQLPTPPTASPDVVVFGFDSQRGWGICGKAKLSDFPNASERDEGSGVYEDGDGGDTLIVSVDAVLNAGPYSNEGLDNEEGEY